MSAPSRKGSPDDAFVSQLGDRLERGPEAGPPNATAPFPPPPVAPPPARAHVPPAAAFPPPHSGFSEDSATDQDGYLDGAPPADVPMVGAGDPFADFEDDIQGESTRIDTEHLLAEEATSILHQAPERPYLRVEKGKDEGKEFFLNPGDTGVGRSIDNDVILTDIAVSRRHLTIVLSDAGLLKIVDLGSGNGSTVNGSRVREAPLNHGDRIELGETTLIVQIPGQAGPGMVPGMPGAAPVAAMSGQTTDEDAVPSASAGVPTAGVASPGLPHHPGTPIPTDYIPAPRAQDIGPFGIPKPWLFAFLAISGVIVALVGATVTALVLRDDGSAAADRSEAYNRGVAAFDTRDWDGAEAAFREALQQRPDDAASDGYLQRIGAVRRDLEAIARARGQLEEENYQGALNEISNITEAELVRADVDPVRQLASIGRVGELKAQALEAADEGEDDRARELLGLLTTFESQTSTARDAIDEVEAALDGEGEQIASAGSTSMGRPSSGSSDSSSSRSSSTSSSSSRSSSMSRRSSSMSSGSQTSRRGAEDRVLALYRSGNFDGASARARELAETMESSSDRRALLALADRVNQFKGYYAAARRNGASPATISRAVEADRRISGGHYADRLQGSAVGGYVTEARRAFSRNDHVRGCRSVNQALRADPSNGQARSLLAQCETRARTMLREARGLESSNPTRARALYSQIRQIVPSSNEIHREAYRRGNALARRGRDEDE